MNKCTLKSSILLILIISTSFTPFMGLNTGLFKDPEVNVVKNAGSWTVSPISIDGNNPSSDWAYYAATYPWCFGSGTENDPYIIENVTIQGTGVEDLISIDDTQDFFTIRNCKLYEGRMGIYLDWWNVANGKIINNNISLNTVHGIGAYYSENLSIINNIIQNNDHTGIYTEYITDLLISGNDISHNTEAGITFLSSYGNDVINNSLYDNGVVGIKLYESSRNTIFNNTVKNHVDGIHVDNGAVICRENNISQNIMQGNGNGILVEGLDNLIRNNTINGNTRGINLAIGSHYIENNIVSSNTDSGILVGSSYNNITNNDLKFNLNGIRIQSLRNKIEGNNIEMNTNNGILLRSANNNTIAQNLIRQNQYFGIYLDGVTNNPCYYNIISRNIITENSFDGIYSWECDSNIFLENNITNHMTQYGIDLHASDNNFFRGNRLYNNLNGIGCLDATDNIFERNNFTYNDNGVYLEAYCQRNIFSENEFNNNFNYGINIDRDYMWWNPLAYTNGDNLIYNNSFIGNTIHAFSNSTYDFWNSSTIGNYWDDFFTGVDINDDGISEIPYSVSIVPFTQDFLPIYDDGDDPAPPIISIVSPIDYQIIGINSPSFQILISGLHVDTVWYHLLGGSVNYTISGNRGKINQGLWDEFGNGTVTLRFFVNDSLGYGTFDEITIRKDMIQPQLVVNTPINDNLYDNITPTFNVELSDPNLDTSWYSLDGGLKNIIFTTNSSINQTLWESTPDGQVEITFYVNDTAGNLIQDLVTVRKDTHAPVITITSPNSYDLFGNSTINFIVEIFDLNLEKMWYTIVGSLVNITFISNGTFDTTLWNSFGSGDLTLVFYANDTHGRISTENVIISKDVNPPSLSIINPTSGETFYVIPPEYEISVTDPHLDLVWYTIDGGITTIFITDYDDLIDQSIWNSAPSGDIILEFYASDSLGNIQHSVVLIQKETVSQGTPPPEIPGFNNYLIITLSLGTVFIIILKRKKIIKI